MVADLWKNMWDHQIHCHYLSPFSCYDLLSSKYKKGAYLAHALDYETKNYVELQNMDECVKKVFF